VQTPRLLLALIACLPLAACWSAEPYYAAADAVSVIPDGSYRMAEPGSTSQEGDRITVRTQGNHIMALTGADHPWQGIAVPIDPARKTWFLLQLEERDPANADRRPKALYMLLDAQPSGLFVTILPCTGSIAEAVERAGGFVSRDPQSAASCSFPDKATLVAQLATVLRDTPKHDIALIRDVP
jgi:hypothetical protein